MSIYRKEEPAFMISVRKWVSTFQPMLQELHRASRCLKIARGARNEFAPSEPPVHNSSTACICMHGEMNRGRQTPSLPRSISNILLRRTNIPRFCATADPHRCRIDPEASFLCDCGSRNLPVAARRAELQQWFRSFSRGFITDTDAAAASCDRFRPACQVFRM